jgi:hypothetical protein
MANEVTGKTSKFFFNGVEQAIQNDNLDVNFTMADSTSTSTTSPGSESVPLRKKVTLKVDALLYDAFGSEIATGTLVAGNKYLVTASAGLFDSIHAVGAIFVSDGTETCTALEKVKLHGAEITGGTLEVSIGGTYACTAADYVVKYGEADSTTTSTDPTSMESVALRMKATSKFEALMYRTTANRITNSAPASTAIVLTFKPGTTVTGNAILHQMSIVDAVNDKVKVTYNAEWQGVPVEVNCGFMTLASALACNKVYETGSGTNNEISGTAILLGKSITADVNSETKISYDGVFNGAIVPAVYS